MLDPLLSEVFRRLPKPIEGFDDDQRREEWLAAFKATFDLLYPTAPTKPESEGE